MRVIDFHAHAFPEKIAVRAVEHLEDYYQVLVPNAGDISQLLRHARDGAVEHLVLSSAATKPEVVKVNNDWVASIVSLNPDLITGFGSIHAGTPDFVSELGRMGELGLKGIKIHPDFQGFDIDDPRMWPIYEEIGDRFIVLFHVGDIVSQASSPRKLAKVLDEFPKMRIIAAHLGGWSRWDEAKECLLKRDIYIDTSSTFWCLPKEEIVGLIRYHGLDRVLFGTDYPMVSHKQEIKNIMSLPLTETEKEKIFYENAKGLLDHLL